MGERIECQSIRNLPVILWGFGVNSRPIYLRELDGKDNAPSSNDSVSSSFIENERKIEAEEHLLSQLLARLEELERQEAAQIQ